MRPRLAFALAGAAVLAATCAAPSPSGPPSGVQPPIPPSESAATLPPTHVPSPPLTPVPAGSGVSAIPYSGPEGVVIPLELVDTAGLGVRLRLASPAEQAAGRPSVSDDTDVGTLVLGPRELLVSWVGTICEVGLRVVVDGRDHVTVTGPPHDACDLARHHYHAVLEFPDGIDPADVRVMLQRPAIRD